MTRARGEGPASGESRVGRALDRVLGSRRPQTLRIEREAGSLRLVILSDQHKGRRDGADDFARCEQAYRAALEHYRTGSFELAILGDSEELWESYPRTVFGAYRETLAAEAGFARDTGYGYLRVWGNHDDLWRTRVPARRYFGALAAGRGFPEGIVLTVVDRTRDVGACLLVHGHQGTLDGDLLAPVARFLTRHLYRHLQRLLRIPASTPASDFSIRDRHERMLQRWVARRPGLLLVTGHTHRALFAGGAAEAAEGAPARVFNAGCCSYSDGSITGLELAASEVRLVRWTAGGQRGPEVVLAAPLAAVFAAP